MNPGRPIGWVTAVILAIGLYLVGSSLYISRTDGLLKLTSSDPNALLSISQNDKEAKTLGIGIATVWLKPGAYQVAAGDGARQSFHVVQISKGQTETVRLTPTEPFRAPTVENIKFLGTDALVGRGLTTSQITKMKSEFFQFKPTAETVSINQTSIQPGPRDPNTAVAFSLMFSVTIDNSGYKAVAVYSGLNDMHMKLYDNQSGRLVYDSAKHS